MSKISKLLGIRNVMVVLLLSIMFLNMQGYWYVFAMLPIVYVIICNEVYRAYDNIFILFVLFGIWYSICSPPLAPTQYAVFILVYPMLYLVDRKSVV